MRELPPGPPDGIPPVAADAYVALSDVGHSRPRARHSTPDRARINLASKRLPGGAAALGAFIGRYCLERKQVLPCGNRDYLVPPTLKAHGTHVNKASQLRTPEFAPTLSVQSNKQPVWTGTAGKDHVAGRGQDP
jgi:hypothetical protein